MKKFYAVGIIALVSVLLLASAIPVLAASPGGGGRLGLLGVQVYKGEVTLVNVTDQTITVVTKKEGTVEIKVAESTRYHLPAYRPASLSDIEIGSTIVALVVGEPPVAKHVLLIPGKPMIKHIVGMVTDYVPLTNITILTKKGETFTFEVTEETRFHYPPGVTEIEEGQLVTVVCPRLPWTQRLIAKLIVVHPGVVIKGNVEVMPEGLIGEWIIDGQEVTVDENTVITGKAGNFRIGAMAVVIARHQPDDSLLALRIWLRGAGETD